MAVPPDVTSATASSLAVDIRTFPWIRRLASDYAFAYEQVAPFFAGNPALPAAWADTITRSQSCQRQPAEVARVIAAQQERRGAPRASRDAAAKLADAATRVVITGQQAGAFGGPLFTLLKALTAMKLAAQVSRDHRVAVVPVFWVGQWGHGPSWSRPPSEPSRPCNCDPDRIERVNAESLDRISVELANIVKLVDRGTAVAD